LCPVRIAVAPEEVLCAGARPEGENDHHPGEHPRGKQGDPSTIDKHRATPIRVTIHF
jgi:hypothetical protein